MSAEEKRTPTIPPSVTRMARKTTSVRMAAVRDVGDRRDRFLRREGLGIVRKLRLVVSDATRHEDAVLESLRMAWDDGAVHAMNLEQQVDVLETTITRYADDVAKLESEANELKRQLSMQLRGRSNDREG